MVDTACPSLYRQPTVGGGRQSGRPPEHLSHGPPPAPPSGCTIRPALAAAPAGAGLGGRQVVGREYCRTDWVLGSRSEGVSDQKAGTLNKSIARRQSEHTSDGLRPEPVNHLERLGFHKADTGTISTHGRAPVEIALATQSGNFNSRSIAWKRGSLRNGSKSGSVFRSSSPGSRKRNAVSSHSSALARSPHCP